MNKQNIWFARNGIGIMLAAVVVFWVSHSALANDKPDAASSYGGVYRAPLLTEPTTLDPALYTDIYSMNVAQNLFDGLVRFDKELNVLPAIARRWKIARDYRTYIFELREDVRFHNGRGVIAADFVHSFTRILDPQTASPVASLFFNIEGAKDYHEGKATAVSGLRAPQRYILEIRLREPFAPFLSILAMTNAKVIPVEALDEHFSKHPVGTGPFKFSAWEPGKSISLQANPDYFAGPVYLDGLRFQFYSDGGRERAFADFNSGLLDHALIPSDQYESVNADVHNHSYQVISKPGLNLIYLGMNQAVKPFDDVRVRQAINYAVDTDAIVSQIIKRGSVPARGILPPGIAGFDPDLKPYHYDPQKALALLAEAGFPQGEGFPAVELWTVSKSTDVHKALEIYKDYLADIGLEVSIKTADNWKAFVKAIADQKASIFYAAWYADYPDADNFFYPLIHSSSRTNRSGFRDLWVDEQIVLARTEVDYLKRAALYREIEKRVVESAPIVSQHINSNSYVFRPAVQGIAMSHLGIIYLPFHQLWFNTEQSLREQPIEQRKPDDSLAASR